MPAVHKSVKEGVQTVPSSAWSIAEGVAALGDTKILVVAYKGKSSEIVLPSGWSSNNEIFDAPHPQGQGRLIGFRKKMTTAVTSEPANVTLAFTGGATTGGWAILTADGDFDAALAWTGTWATSHKTPTIDINFDNSIAYSISSTSDFPRNRVLASFTHWATRIAHQVAGNGPALAIAVSDTDSNLNAGGFFPQTEWISTDYYNDPANNSDQFCGASFVIKPAAAPGVTGGGIFKISRVGELTATNADPITAGDNSTFRFRLTDDEGQPFSDVSVNVSCDGGSIVGGTTLVTSATGEIETTVNITDVEGSYAVVAELSGYSISASHSFSIVGTNQKTMKITPTGDQVINAGENYSFVIKDKRTNDAISGVGVYSLNDQIIPHPEASQSNGEVVFYARADLATQETVALQFAKEGYPSVTINITVVPFVVTLGSIAISVPNYLNKGTGASKLVTILAKTTTGAPMPNQLIAISVVGSGAAPGAASASYTTVTTNISGIATYEMIGNVGGLVQTTVSAGSFSKTASTIVLDEVSGIIITPKNPSAMNPGEIKNFSSSVNGSGAVEQSVIWSVPSGESSGSIDEFGAFTAGSVGATAVIRATSLSDSAVFQEVLIYLSVSQITFPENPAQDSSKFSIERENPAHTSNMEGGYMTSRAKHTRPPRRTITAGFTDINQQEKEALDAFWLLTKGGSRQFKFTNPDTSEVIEVRFKGQIKFMYRGLKTDYRWDATVNMEEV